MIDFDLPAAGEFENVPSELTCHAKHGYRFRIELQRGLLGFVGTEKGFRSVQQAHWRGLALFHIAFLYDPASARMHLPNTEPLADFGLQQFLPRVLSGIPTHSCSFRHPPAMAYGI
ncbi:MAG TPA: hypothetical protein VHC72_10470 [Bryobacteraceae bacterium]|nr:hypothetical protein [Bryobacteraceae bacterium]